MRKILSFFAASLLFAGCQEEIFEEIYTPQLSAPLAISVCNTTRSFDDELKWSWEENDQITGYQNMGDKSRNILALKNGSTFHCSDFGYHTAEAADFHFFYAVENEQDHTLTAYQDGTWRPVYVGTATATTIEAIDHIEMSHLSSALEVRVWKGDKTNHTERKVTAATLSSNNDFIGKWTVADDLTYTQSLEGKEISLTDLDTSTVVFNMPVNEEGFAKNEFTLTLTYEGKDYTYSLPALTFETGKRTIMNITIATTAALLPKGSTVKDKIPTNATSVKFVINSDFAEGNNIAATTSDYPIYVVVKNETEVEFHTPAEKYMANADCEGMFSNKKQLTSIDLTNIDTSNVTTMFEMFYYCERLTELDLSHFNTSNVTNMAEMFKSCSGLTSLDLGNFNTSKVTTMASMFYSCTGLTSLDLGNFDTSKVTNMSFMFSSCTGLTSLDLSNFNTSKVTKMAFMFDDCTGLTSLDLRSFNFSKVLLPKNQEKIFRNVGNNYSPNRITITITNGRNFSEYLIGSGNYKIVYVN